MADLEVDQSSLPPVQEVSQYFSVLEDGVLAHHLQEQEIEQYYSSNIQRNQLVQKDIRVAKRLQDEEQQRAQMLQEPVTRQLEEQDSEYAHRIQEEIQRAAEDSRKREEEDEEIAKRIQEEEELYTRQRNSCRRTDGRDNSSSITSPNTHQPRQPLISEEEEFARHSRRYSTSPSPPTSDYEADYCERSRSFNREYTDNVERRPQPMRKLPLRRHSGQSHSSIASQTTGSGHLLGGWGNVVHLIKNDLSEQGYRSYSSDDELFEPIYKLERVLSRRQKASERLAVQGTRISRHSSMRDGNSRMQQDDRVGRMERHNHSDYVDRNSVHSESRLMRRYSSRDCKSRNEKRHVRFQDDQKCLWYYTDGHPAFEENHVGRRELRSCAMRPCPCDIQVDRRTSLGKVNRTYRHMANGVRNSLSQEIREEEEDRGRLRERGRWEGDSCRIRGEHRPRAYSVREWRWEGRESRQYSGEPSRRRGRCERRQGNQEDRLSSEEEVDREWERRREETRMPRHPQRSLSASCRGRSPGAGQRMNRTSLDLGELRQVLQDEELANRLQAEEEELFRGDLASAYPLERTYPKGDFTVAQVAQDEEIARFMQKQEIKAELRAREDCDFARGHREMSHVYDHREVYDVQMPRERLNSEGLVSPTVEYSPEHQPPSPVTMTGQQHSFRNIAEELDPTFQRKEIVPAGPSISGTCQIQTPLQAGSCTEPTFVTPTKRQNEKPGRTKSKEKKENTKSKENCKQQ